MCVTRKRAVEEFYKGKRRYGAMCEFNVCAGIGQCMFGLQPLFKACAAAALLSQSGC